MRLNLQNSRQLRHYLQTGVEGALFELTKVTPAHFIERDAAGRNPANTNPTPALPPQIDLGKLKADDVDARIDASKGIEGQINDFSRIVSEGDYIVSNWKTNQTQLNSLVGAFRGHLLTSRDRLANLIGSYPDFSDLKIVDQSVLGKLSQAIDNLLGAVSQLGTIPPSEYESSVDRYINPLNRQLNAVKQWAETLNDNFHCGDGTPGLAIWRCWKGQRPNCRKIVAENPPRNTLFRGILETGGFERLGGGGYSPPEPVSILKFPVIREFNREFRVIRA